MRSILPIQKSFILLVAWLFVALTGRAQTPTFSCFITNEVRVSSSIYQFDIYLLRTGTTAFEYAGGQWGISVNSAVTNGGSLTPSVVSGTTTLSNTSEAPHSVSLP